MEEKFIETCDLSFDEKNGCVEIHGKFLVDLFEDIAYRLKKAQEKITWELNNGFEVTNPKQNLIEGLI